MTCHFPLTAWKSRDTDDINPKSGKVKMVFREDLGYPNTKMDLPCGQCLGCRLDRARSWAVRILHESSLYPKNCFVTLTYNDENYNPSLNKRDIVLFMKRLRKRYPPKSIRFFQCGEYGDQYGRPHHHIILFNYYPPDAVPFRKIGENQLYLSKEISELWEHGIHSIGDVTYDSACYVAKYCLKKITGEKSEDHYGDLLPEYVTMSRNPGIGKSWFDQFKEDIYNHDKVVVGHHNIHRPPRYYDSMYELHHPSHFGRLKQQRRKNASLNPDNCEERRAVKHKLAQLKEDALKKRTYEGQTLSRPPLRAKPEGGGHAKRGGTAVVNRPSEARRGSYLSPGPKLKDGS